MNETTHDEREPMTTELDTKDRLTLIERRAQNASQASFGLRDALQFVTADQIASLGADLRAALSHFEAIEWPKAATKSDVKLYRGYHVDFGSHAPHCSWSFYHDAYDGADLAPGVGTKDHRHGDGTSEADCKWQIDAQYIEFGLDEDGHYV